MVMLLKTGEEVLLLCTTVPAWKVGVYYPINKQNAKRQSGYVRNGAGAILRQSEHGYEADGHAPGHRRDRACSDLYDDQDHRGP